MVLFSGLYRTTIIGLRQIKRRETQYGDERILPHHDY
jgi:hypothetical protein